MSLYIATNTVTAQDTLEAGKSIYDQKCAKCHGYTGDGQGRAGKSLDHKPTQFNRKRILNHIPDEQMRNAIKFGTANMKAFPELTEKEIQSLIDYIRTLAK